MPQHIPDVDLNFLREVVFSYVMLLEPPPGLYVYDSGFPWEKLSVFGSVKSLGIIYVCLLHQQITKICMGGHFELEKSL